MKIGTKKAWRDLAAFLLIFGVLVAFGSLALSNMILWMWYGVLVLLSAVFLWRFWRVRHDSERAKAIMDGRWGSVLPPKVWHWMIGADEDSNSQRRHHVVASRRGPSSTLFCR